MKTWAVATLATLGVLVLMYVTLMTGTFRENIPAAEAAENVTVVAVPLADGFDRPTLVTHAPGNASLYLVEQRGVVRILDPDGTRHPYNLVDLSDRVGTGAERGLLGLAFPPDHAATGAFYVHYSDKDGDTVLSRLTLDDPHGGADADTEQVLLQVTQPYPNHNGGTIAFGPDGYLYMALGDGGLAADPQGNGQDPSTLLGSILRLEVGGNRTEAAAAPGNPFEDGHPMVYHYGLRNPWRMSFDASGGLWIADVGQDHAEEVNYAPPGSAGLNFGWVVYEGSQKYRQGDAPGHVAPVAEYDHDGGHCSVTGGHVWDHVDAGPLRGAYVYGDYCSGTVWSHDPETEQSRVVAKLDARISSFGEGADGTLYVVDHGGRVLELVAR